jgi:hypothetical protein
MATTDRRPDIVARNRDVDNRGVMFFAVSLAIATIAVGAAVLGLFRFLDERKDREDRNLSPMVAAALKRTPPSPRLEPLPLAPRAALTAEENRILSSYGWVDKNAGVVRIPIEQAMEILAKRGLPPSRPMPAVPGMAAPTPSARVKK